MTITNRKVRTILARIEILEVQHKKEMTPLEDELNKLRKKCVHSYKESVRGTMKPFKVTAVCTKCGNVDSYEDY